MTCTTFITRTARNFRTPAALRLALLCGAFGATACGDDNTTVLLAVTSPFPGQVLSTATDDKNPKTAQFEFDVVGSSMGVREGTSVNLFIDNEKQMASGKIGADGAITLSDVVLPEGTHSIMLKTVTGGATSDAEQVYTLNHGKPGQDGGGDMNDGGTDAMVPMMGCPTVTFVHPEAPASGDKIVLGGDSACPSGAAFTTTVEIATNAPDGRTANLLVNGKQVATAKVKGARAVFEKVALEQRSTPNTLKVEIADAQGVLCPADFPGGVSVDCAGPDCSITSPTPVAYTDSNSVQTLFINASMRGKKGFDIDVTSSKEAAGQTFELIVDRNSRKPVTATAKKDGTATLAGVSLAEGAHTVEAKCTDAAGNTTYSGESAWVVDITACDFAITSPTAPFNYVATDDTDNATTGVQVDVTSTLTSTDCSEARAKPCDSATGITGLDFASIPGTSPLVSNVTLTSAASQTLCVDVMDHAGNVASNSVDVSYLSTPTLQIESPSDGTLYNVAGGGLYTQTADTLSTVCKADVAVWCAELGATIELRHDVTDVDPIASALCDTKLNTDPALPSGFLGMAHFEAVSILSGSTHMGSLVATQSLVGSSGRVSVAASGVISLQGDCRPPGLASDPNFCSSGSFGVQLGTDHVIRDVPLIVTSEDMVDVTLHVSNAGGSIDSSTQQSGSGASHLFTFSNVDLGTAGSGSSSVTVELTVTDAFANTTVRSCSIGIALDLPSLTLTAPTSSQNFGVGGGCNSGVAGVYGVPFSAIADQTANRQAAVTVGTFTKAYSSLSSTTLSDCVPVAEGLNTLSLDLTSTSSGGHVSDSVTFSIDTLVITAPTSNQVIGAGSTCSTGVGGETGVTVSASADPIHNGRNVSIQAGSNRQVQTTVAGGAISACVPASQGSNTVTISILDAGSVPIVSHIVPFSLIAIPPSSGIPITTVTIPADGPTYRTDKVTLAWAAPTQDFAGQLKTYALRCSNTALDLGVGSPSDHDTWWTNATVITPAPAVTPPSASATVKFRIGEAHHCELRAADALGQLTPLVNSTRVNYAFRQHLVAPTSTGQRIGTSVAAIGDVNNDSLSDVLVGGYGEAELIFGSSTPWAGSAPNVVFQGDPGDSDRWAVAGLGDFNKDGLDDFAISNVNWVNPVGGAYHEGQVFVFYGRPTNDWPSTIDLTGGCEADLCFNGANPVEFLGWSVAGVGDFNADGTADMAIGADEYPFGDGAGRLYVILGKAYENGHTKAGGQKFWKIAVSVPDDVSLQGFELSSDGVTTQQLGTAVVGVGAFDGLAGDDLVVSAQAFTQTAQFSDRIFFLSGRSYDMTPTTGDSGLKSLTLTDFGFITSGTPSGLPLDVFPTWGFYGGALAALGNAYVVPGGARVGALDLAVQVANRSFFLIYPGDNQFSAADRIQIGGLTDSSFLGVSMASGYSSAGAYSAQLGAELGDLDGDGKAELCAGEAKSSLTGLVPGEAWLWYSDVTQSNTTSHALSYLRGSPMDVQAGPDTAARTLQYVGDLNGDGALDMVVANPEANANKGETVLLY